MKNSPAPAIREAVEGLKQGIALGADITEARAVIIKAITTLEQIELVDSGDVFEWIACQRPCMDLTRPRSANITDGLAAGGHALMKMKDK